jgi:transposase
MAGRRLMTLDVRELVRRLRAGQTDRAIAHDLRVARKTVAKYRALAQEEGFLEGALPSAEELDRRLGERLTHSTLPRQSFKAARFEEVIRKLRRQGVEMKALCQRLQEDHGFTGSYSSLRRFVRHLEASDPEAFVRIEVDPGEEAQVDFGSAGEMADPKTGELKKAWVFVMTLSHSRHQYATFVFDQKVETWLRCHREAFEWFGGVPKKVVVDNLKAAIVRAVLHDPVVQRSYRELAEHYGFLISPCRPRTPQHKGKVESGVHYVKRNFLAGRDFRDVVEANEKLIEWVEKTAGTRIHGTTKDRPLARFLEAEQDRLLDLPTTPFDLGVWKKAKLHADCHVVVDSAYYSAPHRLIGQRLWVRTNGRDVHIFHDYERVATHVWGPPGTRRTNKAHYPPDKVAWLMKTPQWCRKRSQAIGPTTADFVGRLLGERPLDRLRTAQAILRLADKYTPRRLEEACRRSLFFNEVSYISLKRILEKGLESEPLPDVIPLSRKRYLFARPGSEIFTILKGGLDHGHQVPVDTQAQGFAVVGDSGNTGRPQPAGHRGQALLRGVSGEASRGRGGAPGSEAADSEAPAGELRGREDTGGLQLELQSIHQPSTDPGPGHVPVD